MKPFTKHRDGSVSARFDAAEIEILRRLASDTAELAGAVAEDPGAAADDVALRRLLPDAYPDDPDAAAEFRRFTAAGIAGRKAQNAQVLVDSLAQPAAGTTTVRLEGAEALAWVRSLTDIRLVLAARLGIEHDGDEGDIVDEEAVFRRAVYDWLGAVQESLVAALAPRG